jgi:hypothetical protein
MRKSTLILLSVLTISFGLRGQSLLLFGGENHKVFLGCLNCDKHSSSSIWNEYGDYGSKYNMNSIWNQYGEYGGQYSVYSPFNSYSNDPPIIVDKDGNSYGYFTTNKYFNNRTTLTLPLFILDYWDSIMKDVSGYYDKIFK